ncbi:hypothetical protein [Devosia sp. 2618]
MDIGFIAIAILIGVALLLTGHVLPSALMLAAVPVIVFTIVVRRALP